MSLGLVFISLYFDLDLSRIFLKKKSLIFYTSDRQQISSYELFSDFDIRRGTHIIIDVYNKYFYISVLYTVVAASLQNKLYLAGHFMFYYMSRSHLIRCQISK